MYLCTRVVSFNVRCTYNYRAQSHRGWYTQYISIVMILFLLLLLHCIALRCILLSAVCTHLILPTIRAQCIPTILLCIITRLLLLFVQDVKITYQYYNACFIILLCDGFRFKTRKSISSSLCHWTDQTVREENI